jgi:hypothetical protein
MRETEKRTPIVSFAASFRTTLHYDLADRRLYSTRTSPIIFINGYGELPCITCDHTVMICSGIMAGGVALLKEPSFADDRPSETMS